MLRGSCGRLPNPRRRFTTGLLGLSGLLLLTSLAGAACTSDKAATLTPGESSPTIAPLAIDPSLEAIDSLEEGLYILDLTSRQLTLIDPNGHAPRWSDDGEFFAYGASLADTAAASELELGCAPQAPRYCGLAIQLMDSDSGETRELAVGEAPSWMPGGHKLLFSQLNWNADDDMGRGEIHLVDIDSDRESVLAEHSPGQLDQHPKWSFDASTVIYAFGGSVYRLASDGSGSPGVVTSGYPVAVSPVSNDIVIARSSDDSAPSSSLTGISVDAPADESAISAGVIGDKPANWSPDGRRVAYAHDSDPPSIGVWDWESGDNFNIDPAWYEPPVWFPDGTRFAYAVFHDAPSPDAWPNSEVFLSPADGSSAPLKLSDGWPLVWLPDGSGLIVRRRISGVGQETSPAIREEIALVGLAGDVHTLVKSVPIICTGVAMSPDGTKLAISAHNCRE